MTTTLVTSGLARQIYRDNRIAVFRETHRVFVYLFCLQWIGAISYSVITAPLTYQGSHASINYHLTSAIVVGGLINALPFYLIKTIPDAPLTRHMVTASQMMWSALLIHLTQGRIETHFHVFGSLAFIAFYRDWRLLITAVLVIAGDHLIRGVFWPESVYGTQSLQIWRFLEHTAWVVFESVVLLFACQRSIGEMAAAANHEASLQELHAQIESEVERKTSELMATQKKNDELESELIQVQKLEAIGRLAAGVAHEINTPVQFVSDSTHFIRSGIDDLTNFTADLLSQANNSETLDSRAILARVESLDFEYLQERLPKAIDRSAEGLSRVAEIVRSMKSFAYPDLADMAPADLNEAIRTTLIVAKHEYKYVADVVLDLGDLPFVMCRCGELNQVLVNIIVNAAHAIEDRYRGTEDRGVITITTKANAKNVEITIADTGCGIPEADIHRIFEPFFTTKEVGRGTGQGLSIAHTVVTKKHGGSLNVTSILGKGSTFEITLPITQHTTLAA